LSYLIEYPVILVETIDDIFRIQDLYAEYEKYLHNWSVVANWPSSYDEELFPYPIIPLEIYL